MSACTKSDVVRVLLRMIYAGVMLQTRVGSHAVQIFFWACGIRCARTSSMFGTTACPTRLGLITREATHCTAASCIWQSEALERSKVTAKGVTLGMSFCRKLQRRTACCRICNLVRTLHAQLLKIGLWGISAYLAIPGSITCVAACN